MRKKKKWVLASVGHGGKERGACDRGEDRKLSM